MLLQIDTVCDGAGQYLGLFRRRFISRGLGKSTKAIEYPRWTAPFPVSYVVVREPDCSDNSVVDNTILRDHQQVHLGMFRAVHQQENSPKGFLQPRAAVYIVEEVLVSSTARHAESLPTHLPR